MRKEKKMSEYLKREDVRRAVLHNEGDAVIAAIDELPTVDAVQVVRCRECIHRDPEDHRCDCGGHEWVIGKIVPVEDDWFCASGERKEPHDA